MASKTKKMTIKYWVSLSEGSRKRALQHCFPTLPYTVEMLLDEKPKNVKDRGEYWWYVFSRVRIPDDSRVYKTVIDNGRHKTYLP